MKSEKRNIFGLDVAALARSDASNLLERSICEKVAVRLAFVNANLANVAYEDKSMQTLLRGFLLLNDGSGINLASKLLYRRPFPDNLNGTDFTPYFLDSCSRPLRIYLLGASPAVSSRAADFFTRRWPRHTVAGYHHGYFAKIEEAQIVDAIRAAKPDLVLVAMGNGLQEQWIERLVPAVAVSAWGVGALFDFLCGEAVRAPAWMRKLGIEWVYRLLQEPARLWRRYLLGNPIFVLRLLREFWLRALDRKGAAAG
jgi:exopolysaccharide biosynthesis WecB/TagA/CpsF family protein